MLSSHDMTYRLDFGALEPLLDGLFSSGMKAKNRAFTLQEFLSLIATVCVLIFLFLPLARGTRSTNTIARCMSNMRYLTVAWQLYAEENHGRLVENYDGGDAQGGAIAKTNPSSAPWACGWEDWTLWPDNTNMLFIRNSRYARLSPYITVESNVHKCPSDQYTTVFQRMNGLKERVRSVSMNATLGLPVAKGPFSTIYKLTKRLSDINNPDPAQTFLFLDEHPDSINDPLFWPPTSTGFVDFPGNLHKGAATFSFADGHVEAHHWLGPIRSARVRIDSLGRLARLNPDPDIHWLSYHSQRTGETTY